MKKIVITLLILILVIGAVVAVKKKMATNAAIPPLSSYDLSIKTYTPSEGNVTLTAPVLALVKNDHDATLSAKFPASVLFIAPAGTVVKKGDVLVRLDDRDLMTQKESSISALSAAKDEEKAKEFSLSHEIESHKRTLELLSVKGASIEESQGEESRIALLKSDISGVKAKQVQIKSNLLALNAQLSYTTLCAPVDGIVGETFAAVGGVASVGKPLVSVRAKNGSYLSVRLALGTSAKTVIFENHCAPLHFLQNNNGVDEYRADLPLTIASGAKVEAKIVTFEENGTFLPREAVLFKEAKAYILVVNGHTTKAQEVTIIAKGDEGYVATGVPLAKLAIAKSDILLKLLSGASLAIKG
jgi:multidrug efflux pump subunit AcrA (membrane-fusion protein)